ncbi:MAG: MFS transporter [Lentisphaerae bacterium]|nr:MFS transporter [Lentisphaerota bacterium]
MIHKAKALHDRVRNLNPQLQLFLAGVGLMAIASGIFETTLNNFLNDTFALGADARGFLEFPRELPGFLTALFVGLLFFLPETLIAALSAFALGAGMLGIALWGTNWSVMLVFLTLWSVGVHLIMPVRSSISMDLAEVNRKGRRLGQIQGAGIAAGIIGCGLVWLILWKNPANYSLIFIIGGAAAMLAGFFFLAMRLPGHHLKRPKFIWRREYSLYYTLSFFFGARKQIFLTFAPWVLVKIFNQPATIFAQLYIVASLLGIALQPMLGKAIDRFGERRVLMLDAVGVALVCAGYGTAHLLGQPRLALWILYACMVGDQLLFGTGMARDTYLSKIVLKPEHLNPTLSLGVTINHAVSMSIPAVGGLMWEYWGHGTVFAGAAGIALLMLFVAARLKVPASVRN